jgi:hypothetical protein
MQDNEARLYCLSLCDSWRINGEYAILRFKRGNMASVRERVSFPGILRGGGHETNCTVRATKVSLPGESSVFEYVDYSVEKVSKPLPDGLYQLLAQGKTISLRYQNGSWLSAAA